jgi:hypothetical protein
MRGLTRASVLAFKEETTEGVLKLPTSGTDGFVAIIPDPEFSGERELLESEEQKNSIGSAKPILGLESPTAVFSHYIRASGTSGVAPSYAPVLKGVFGSQAVQATERLTTTGSTVSQVKLASGGSDYARGKAILLKNGAGYVIRPVDTVSGNDLNLGFDLPVAPGAGIGCGKFVNFSPLTSGHPAISAHLYNGNSHSWEAVAGGKVTEMSFDANAGELIQGQFTMVGTRYYFNPIVITSTDTKLDFNDGSARVATIAEGVYTPRELAVALTTAMNAQGSTDTFTVTYHDTGANAGKFTIETDGAALSLLWNTGANAANTVGDKLGFNTAADDSAALTYTSDNEQSWTAGYTPTYDNADPNVAIDNEVLLGDSNDITTACASTISFAFTNENTQVKCVSAPTGVDSNFFNKRSVTITMSVILEKHDTDLSYRFKTGADTKFLYNFGVKSGGNWSPGKIASLYLPSCVVSSFKTVSLEGVVGAEIVLTSFVDASANGEIYLNFL